MSDQVLHEQIDYYRARAHEYDEWFYRLGRYDHGEALNQQWFEEIAIVQAQLLTLPRVHHALELACGTGIWTRDLLSVADRVTAIDTSPEMIAINRGKVESSEVEYMEANLFTWEPTRQYDLVFFSFWLSHVPPEKLDEFLAKVYRALRPGGSVFMIDSRRNATSTARNHLLPRDSNRLTRKLNDGRAFNIVKVFYGRDHLRTALSKAGFTPEVQITPHYFIYAYARK